MRFPADLDKFTLAAADDQHGEQNYLLGVDDHLCEIEVTMVLECSWDYLCEALWSRSQVALKSDKRFKCEPGFHLFDDSPQS